MEQGPDGVAPSLSGPPLAGGPAALSLPVEDLAAIIEQLPSGIIVVDAAGRPTLMNAAGRRIAGRPSDGTRSVPDQAPVFALRDARTGRTLAPRDTPLGRALAGEAVHQVELLYRPAAGGAEAWCLASAVPRRDATGRVVGAVAIFADTTHEHRLQAELSASEARLRTIHQAMACGVIVLDAHGAIVDANAAAQEVLGLSLAELRTQGLLRLRMQVSDANGDAFPAPPDALGVLQARQPVRDIALRFTRQDGTERWLHLDAVPLLDAQGALQQVVLSFIDVTARTVAERALRHQAWHDALTGLPNRTLLHARLEQTLLLAEQEGQPLALLLLDLDGFKEINDTFGHHHGDVVLRRVAERLRACVRATDTVARLGGDEFAVLLPDSDEAAALVIVASIAATLQAPLRVEDQAVRVGASIGLTLAPTQGTEASALLRQADVAMYVAKRGGQPYALYSAARDDYTPERQALLRALRQGIAQGQLVLHYQPQVEMQTGRLVGVEALVRWHHPHAGLLPPARFLPLAEESGLIQPLTHWVVEQALRQARTWQQAGWPLTVAVNLSMLSLGDQTLAATIAALLGRYELAPRALQVEVTETALMADPSRTRAVLAELVALGVGSAIDDYGTGYSCLAYLKALPIQTLKIDRSFVQHMVEDAADAAIVASTIGLAHSLGLQVIAEGVEDHAVWERLAQLGCDVAQGYYLSRPLAADAVLTWARAMPAPGDAAHRSAGA